MTMAFPNHGLNAFKNVYKISWPLPQIRLIVDDRWPSIPVVEKLDKDLRAQLDSNVLLSNALSNEFGTRLVGIDLWCDSGKQYSNQELCWQRLSE